jgi:hypothetical protein
MIGKEYLGDEKTKRILSGEPFWCCAAFIDSDGLQIIEPRESQVHMNWYNSFTKTKIEDLEHRHMLYGYPIKNVSVFDCQEDCRESFMLMLDNLSMRLGKIDIDLIEFTRTGKKSLLERFCEAYENNSSQRFPKGGYTYTEKEYIPPIDVVAVRKTMEKIFEGIKILDMLNRWLEDE